MPRPACAGKSHRMAILDAALALYRCLFRCLSTCNILLGNMSRADHTQMLPPYQSPASLTNLFRDNATSIRARDTSSTSPIIIRIPRPRRRTPGPRTRRVAPFRHKRSRQRIRAPIEIRARGRTGRILVVDESKLTATGIRKGFGGDDAVTPHVRAEAREQCSHVAYDVIGG